ncbi:hypothetical protein LZ32DRAFT_533350, partial [Colletotrichum eremochloae]
SRDVMPGVYKAPEIIISQRWDSKIDIWSVGVMCLGLVQRCCLFCAMRDVCLDNKEHLADITALLGPLLKIFLELSEKYRQY